MKKIMSTGDVARACGVPTRNINYLFECGRLDPDNFHSLGGRRVFTDADMRKVQKALKTIGQGLKANNGEGRKR